MVTATGHFLSFSSCPSQDPEVPMLDPIPPPALEEYLLEAGIVDRSQLSLAKKLQRRQQGPLLMILLELSFIDLDQLRRLLDLGRLYDHAANAG